MNKHTLGPWRVTTGINQMSDMGTTIWHSGPDVLQPCGVYSDAETRGDSLADAKLISAAQDLLDALIDLVDRCEYWQFEVDLEKSKAAIAKSKGETL